MTAFIQKTVALLRSRLLPKVHRIPLWVGITTTSLWLLSLLLRLVTPVPRIATVDLALGTIVFTVVTLAIAMGSKKIAPIILLLLTVTQALILGMSSTLFSLGVATTALALILAFALFSNTITAFAEALSTPPKEPFYTPNKRVSRSTQLALWIVIAFALLLIIKSYSEPGMGLNHHCYFAAAHQSSFHTSNIDKFTEVWEIKPIFHRAFVYGVYALATEVSSFYNKALFEATAFKLYGLWSLLLISTGVFLGRKRFQNISGLPWGYVLFLGVAIQGVMVQRTFEVEEMVFSLGILGLGLLWSQKRVFIFLAPLVFAYITLLKILTIFIPLSLLLFTALLFPISKREQRSFIAGTIGALFAIALFFGLYPQFLTEIGDARVMQQGTVFFFGGVRIMTFIGTTAKALFYNPFIVVGMSSALLLSAHFVSTKRLRELGALFLLWGLLAIIPLTMGKAFTYYALPFTISAFLSTLIFIKEFPSLWPKTPQKIRSVALFLPVAFLLYKGVLIALSAGVLIVIGYLLLQRRYRSTETLFLHLTLLPLLFWALHHTPWKERSPASTKVPSEIMKVLTADTSYRQEEMLYLSFGTVPYQLGMRSSNRYFYTLPLLRHHQMDAVAKAKSGELAYLNRFGKEMTEIFAESNAVKECIAGAEAFSGKYIFHSTNGWCNRELYPTLDSLITTQYHEIAQGKNAILYRRNESK